MKKNTPRENIILSCLVALCLATPAYAHAIKVFASAEGEKIVGFVYFPGGGRAGDVPVEVKNADGEVLARVQTDDKGEFSFVPEVRCDYRFVVSTPDGHHASFVVPAEQLPEGLLSTADKNNGLPEVMGRAGQGAAPDITRKSCSEEDIHSLVRRAVSEELWPLKEQIARYEAKIRLHDILGGTGYILGLCGVVFYFLALRQRG
jgi:nickel transport protein